MGKSINFVIKTKIKPVKENQNYYHTFFKGKKGISQ